jgi:hypothetical protein
MEHELWSLVRDAQQRQRVPKGYGLRPEEIEYSEYEDIEIIPVGRHSSKKALTISLPETVWLPRCIIWIQALEIMTYLQISNVE